MTANKIHPNAFFNNIPVVKPILKKHLGLHLDSKLDIFIKTVLAKVNRNMGLLRLFQ